MLNGTYRIQITPVDMTGFVENPPVETPPPPPPHTLHFTEVNGIPIGIYETQHGKQIIGHFCYDSDVIRFTALGGTPGDELFFFALRLDGNRISGVTYREGLPFSPVEGERI